MDFNIVIGNLLDIFQVKTTAFSGSGKGLVLGADDFLPLFVWVLVKTNFVAAEIEAEYMWGNKAHFCFVVAVVISVFSGLLHPSLLSGEGGYYLTTLSSAVHVLKNFKDSNEQNTNKHLKPDVRIFNAE